jgi:hypothetical protein
MLQVKVLPDGFEYEGQVYKSLSAVAKAITGRTATAIASSGWAERGMTMKRNGNNGPSRHAPATVRCAIYTRKSTDEGLEQEFNSLDAQREAGEAFIRSQAGEGWTCLPDRYDDGGFTGGNMDRPALQRLLADIEAGKIDCVVVYKVDRLSRSLLDFARMMETFEKHHVSFVSVTQQFNTATSMGRLIAERAVVVRPVRARDHQRAHPRQDRRHAAQGEVGRRASPSSATTWTRAASGWSSTRPRPSACGPSSSCTWNTSRCCPSCRSWSGGAGGTSAGRPARAHERGGRPFTRRPTCTAC